MALNSGTQSVDSRKRKVDGTLGRPVYPGPTSGNGKFDGERRDLDGEQSLGIYRCLQCGFINDERRVSSGGGTSDGNRGISVTVTDEVGDPINRRGFCAFCGSANSRIE